MYIKGSFSLISFYVTPVQPEACNIQSYNPLTQDPVQGDVQPRTTQSMKLSIISRVVQGLSGTTPPYNPPDLPVQPLDEKQTLVKNEGKFIQSERKIIQMKGT